MPSIAPTLPLLRARRVGRPFLPALALAALGALVGCASKPPELEPPAVVVAPYGTGGFEVLFAVAPLRNESGTTAAQSLAVSDALVAACEEVRGVRTVPMNRTLEAMRALRINMIASPGQARALADALGADALILGTITAYDPYTPVIGLTIALQPNSDAVLGGGGGSTLDPRVLAVQPTDRATAGGASPADPTSVVSELYDGKNHQVLMDVQRYARGRANRSSALSWRLYTESMDHFTQFAAATTVERLMQREWLRNRGVSAPAARSDEVPTDSPVVPTPSAGTPES